MIDSNGTTVRVTHDDDVTRLNNVSYISIAIVAFGCYIDMPKSSCPSPEAYTQYWVLERKEHW